MLASACASARPVQRPAPEKLAERTHDIHRGVFHQVREGETLFGIGRAYGVSVDDLRRENGIADPAQLAAGSLVFVPRAERTVEPSAANVEPPPGRTVEASGPTAGKVEPRPGRRAQPSQIPRAGSGPLDPEAHGEPLAWPLHGVLVSAFGVRGGEQHEGIDLAAPEGTPILAARSGKVLFAGFQRGYGNLVLVGHDGGIVTIYAHNAENLVSPGDPVSRGQRIARVGRSGNATGPHLHFEVRVGTRPRDPLHFLR
jgi:murein DD-endopeptidase MepM/ murein hydrolase activator NlpD